MKKKVKKQNQMKRTGQIYDLKIFLANKQGKIEEVDVYKFQIKPEPEVLGAEKREPNGKKSEDIDLSDEERELALENIKEWLFRKTTTPINISKRYMWTCTPDFTDEDKKKIKHLYLMEEL